MRTHVEYDFLTGGYKLHAWESTPQGVFPYEYRPTPSGRVDWCLPEDPIEPGTVTAPSITLTAEMVDAIVEHVKGIKPGDVLASAVADARETRDRLLTLVEKLTVHTPYVQEDR